MKEPKGITIEFGLKSNGKFGFRIGKCRNIDMRASYINDDGKLVPYQGGFRLDLKLGRIGGPMPKFYDPKFYKKDFFEREPSTNPFNSGNFWFEWPNIIIPAFYLYIAIPMSLLVYPFKKLREKWKLWQPGIYLGFKGFQVNKDSAGLLDYDEMKRIQNESIKNLPHLDEKWFWETNQGDVQKWLSKDIPVWQWYVMYGPYYKLPINDGVNIPNNPITDEQLEFIKKRPIRLFKYDDKGNYIPTWGKDIQDYLIMIPTGSVRLTDMVDDGLM